MEDEKPQLYTTLLTNGENPFFKKMLELINAAKFEIHLQVYIFAYDTIGQQIATALINSVKRGVKVYAVLDAFGSKELTKKTIVELRDNGVYLRFFSPYLSYKGIKLGRRLHHKILIVDRTMAMVGGINISDNYAGTPSSYPWLDFAVYFEGVACNLVLRTCYRYLPKKIRRKMPSIPSESKNKEELVISRLENDAFKGKKDISLIYRRLIRGSQDHIYIVASYFFPGMRVRRLLKAAANRNVLITLVLPQKSDISLIKRGTSYLYSWLIRNHIRIYEYRPSMVHGKLMSVDGVYTTIGSYNLNKLSDYGSIECNMNIRDSEFAMLCESTINRIIRDDCDEITLQNYTFKNSLREKILNWVSYKFLKISESLLYFIIPTKQTKFKNVSL